MNLKPGDLPGDVLVNRYQIEQLLGKKAGRRTYLGRDQYTGQRVVIKRLSLGEDFEWEDLKLFEREAEVLQALSHPAIPRYLDHFELDLPSGKGFAFVQTYIEAPSLEEHLKSGRTFTETEVIDLAKGILEILIYLQERYPPVIHRDIKPSNLLLANSSNHRLGQVYLIDFGAVQLPHRSGGTVTIVGTYGYMPPEQFGGRAVPASDLFSLGATLIHLVTGQPPADLVQVDQQMQFESMAQLSPSFTAWLKKMVQPGLDRRFTSARTALETLKNPALMTALKQSSAEKITKPRGTKVILQTNAQVFDLYLPSGRNHPASIAGAAFMGFFAIGWNSFLIMWTGMALMAPFPLNIFVSLFSVPFWAVGIGMVIGILFTLFGHIRLRITPQRLHQDFELFGLKRAMVRPSDREDIRKLEFLPRHFRKDADGDRINVNPKIVIHAATRTYELGGNGILSDAELEWLAAELSDWLGLPLEKN
uniref:Serine/threonine protein kinase n=1 Tax=Cyanothece sp. (strain PCC 7425 / ATCC 29141) TaxID=395961 RepID=B8HSQ7_CYAP4